MKFAYALIFFYLIFLTVGLSQNEEYKLPVIDEVKIIVDNWGVPHIYANTEYDLFFAQGFNAARDRLFQFEIWRRQATGTVAEMLGRKELKRDIGTRLFKFRGDIEEELNYYHPRGAQIIGAFVEGINEYIDWINDQPHLLPFEFHKLNVRPRHWTVSDVISRHQGLLGNIEDELDIGRMVHLVGEDKVRELLWFHPHRPNLMLADGVDGSHLLKDILELYSAYRRPVKFSADDMGATESYRRSMLDDDINSIGSNNWVIDGRHTQSEYPMMANDPHRSLAVPSLRYMSHLVGPGWNVIGGGEPEIPGISIGHNDHGAWGLTVFSTDAEDLYVYKLHPEDPDRYWHNGSWHRMEVIEERIPIKGEEDHAATLKYSVHGPVVFQDPEAQLGYAVRCGWLEPGGSPYLASLRMNQSVDFESFREACNYSHIPGENMVWADRDGHIGWQAVGIAPRRSHFSGLVPVPGDGSHEWDGYLEIKKKPNKYDPEEGVIVTANENLTSRQYPYPDAIGYEWSDPIRGDRIAELLGRGTKITMTDMMAIQNDKLSIPARMLVPFLGAITFSNPRDQRAKDMLMEWDFVMDIDAVEATIYRQWELELKSAVKKRKVPEEIFEYIGDLQFKILYDFIAFPDGDFGKDPIANRDTLLAQAFVLAMDHLESRFGADTKSWQYGQSKYKHVLINHALGHLVSGALADSINLGPVPRGGYGYTVGNTSNNLNQSHGATFKILCDTEDWDRTLAINAPGQSGDPRSEHYRDLFPIWAQDGYFPLFFSKEKIESVSRKQIILTPNRKE